MSRKGIQNNKRNGRVKAETTKLIVTREETVSVTLTSVALTYEEIMYCYCNYYVIACCLLMHHSSYEISIFHVDDPIVHHGAGLGRFSHSMHAQQTPLKFCSNQLNPERDPQDHNKFQRNSIDSAIYSFFSHPFPSNTFSQPFPLYHDELKRFDHEVSQSMLQQIINPGKLNLCSLQSGVTPHLPALQMASCTQAKSNADSSLCISGTKELWGFCKTKSR